MGGKGQGSAFQQSMNKAGISMMGMGRRTARAYAMAGEGSMAARQMGSRSGYTDYQVMEEMGQLPRQGQGPHGEPMTEAEYAKWMQSTDNGTGSKKKKSSSATVRSSLVGINRPGSLLKESTKLG
jgi:hypothetical protein